MRIDVFTRNQSAGPAPRCPFSVAYGPSAISGHRCSLADARVWRPSAHQQSTTCGTPQFAHCPRFIAASGTASRDDAASRPVDPHIREAERTLGWIGVGALGCLAGIAITAMAFLLLPAPTDTADGMLQSHVAGVIATAPAETQIGSGAAPDYQMTTAEQKAEILRPARVSPAAASPAEPEDVEPPPEPAPVASHAQGEPAGSGESPHVVVEGETLWGIAAANGVGVADLAARNGLSEDALVMTGDVLVIPASTTPQ